MNWLVGKLAQPYCMHWTCIFYTFRLDSRKEMRENDYSESKVKEMKKIGN